MNDKIDMKPIILPPFKRFCVTVGEIPSSYIESMSYYETLLWLCKYLSEKVIPAIDNNAEALREVQSLFSELQEYVNTYFDNLDVQEEINNKLDEMFEDGDLAELIQNMILDVNGSLTASIEYKDCSEYINGVTNMATPPAGYTQGMTTTPTSIIVARRVGGTLENTSNMCYLQEISKETKLVTKEAYLELFHANSLAYNESAGEVYVACCNNADGTNNNNIIVVNYGDFTIKQTITPPTSITDTNRVRSVSYDNENGVLALGDISDVFIMQNWSTVKTHIELDNTNTADWYNVNGNVTVQEAKLYNDRIYLTRLNPNGITTFDLSGNVLKNYYDINISDRYLQGELESISVEDNGDVYMAFAYTSQSDTSVDANTRYYKMWDISIFKSNFKHNGYLNESSSLSVPSALSTLYVDCDTTNKVQNGTQLNPFKCIQQAINCIQALKWKRDIVISLVGSNKQYSCFVGKSDVNISIDGNGNKVYGGQVQSQRLMLTDLTFNCLDSVRFNATSLSSFKITDLSNVYLNTVSFVGATKIDNALTISNSDITMYNCTFDNFTNLINANASNVKSGAITATNYDYYWRTAGQVTIDFESTNVLSLLNPASAKLPITTFVQSVPFTYNGTTHTVTFDNTAIDRGGYPPSEYLFTWQISPEGGTAVYMIVRSVHNERVSCSWYSSSTQYNCYCTVSHTNNTGVFTFSPTITKTASNGTTTDITSTSTFTIQNVRRVA